MRIVAITRVLDEADIIEAFARHTAAYVDHHVFLDNGSADGTLDILRALHAEGLPMTLLQTGCVSFNEAGHLTQMFRLAIRDRAADWVACLDADEFIDDRGSPVGLRDMLRALEEATPAVAYLHLPSADYVATAADDPAQPTVPQRIRRRRPLGANGKAIARGGPSRAGAGILAGGHAVLADGAPDGSPGGPPGLGVAQQGLQLAHYSERSPFQVITKVVRGWSRVLAAEGGVADSGAAYHYKQFFEVLRDRPADLLRDSGWMDFKNDAIHLVDDPITYRGGPLRLTPGTDDAMRAVQSLVGVVQDLALRHRRLLESFPDVRRQVAAWDAELTRLL